MEGDRMSRSSTVTRGDAGELTRAVETVGMRMHDYFMRVKNRLMYFTEEQIALVEDLYGRRFPKGRLEHQEHIVRQMVDECYINGCTSEEAKAAKHLRLAEELRRRGM